MYWTFADYPRLICNRLKIAKPKKRSNYEVGFEEGDFKWPEETQLNCPNIAVLDSNANLSMTTQRYALSDENLPFIYELSRDVTLSFIAHALVCGPTSRTEAHLSGKQSKPPLRDRSRVVLRSERACVFTERSVVKMQALRNRVESLRNYVAYPLLGMQRVKQDGWGRRRH